MPKISVIMGVYQIKNRKMAEEAIGSVLSQSYQDFELIICDDGSGDDSYKILKDICKKAYKEACKKGICPKEKRIKIIRNKRNRGLAYSLNRCLKIAKGEYIARMDIDDVSYLDRFRKQAGFLDGNREFTFVGTWAGLFSDDKDSVWGIRKMPEYPRKEDFLFRPPVIHASIMIRRQAMEAVRGYRVQWDTARAEDYELFMRLYVAGYKAYNLQEPLYKIREDRDAYRRRSYRHRIEEAHVRLVGFWRLGLYPLGLPYVLKPLVVGLIPQRILKILRKEGIS